MPSLLEPRFYGDGTRGAMLATMATIRDAGCSFLIAGRALDGGTYANNKYLVFHH